MCCSGSRGRHTFQPTTAARRCLSATNIKAAHPRLYFDGNSQLAERSFALVQGPLDDLKALGEAAHSALGSRFTFVQEEFGPSGEWDAIMLNGTIAYSSTMVYFALADPDGVHWLSELAGNGAKQLILSDVRACASTIQPFAAGRR